MARRVEDMLASAFVSFALACFILGIATQFTMHVVPSFMPKARQSPQAIGLISWLTFPMCCGSPGRRWSTGMVRQGSAIAAP